MRFSRYPSHGDRTSSVLTVGLMIMTLLMSSILIQTSGGSSLDDPSDGSMDAGPTPSDLHTQANLIKTVSNVSSRSQSQLSSSRTIAVHNGTIFFIYAWFNGSAVTLSMIASNDGGENWTSKLDIYSIVQYDNIIFKEVLVWKGDIYVFFCRHHDTNRWLRAVYMKKADVDSWQNLRTATLVTIRANEGHDWELAYDDNYIYMAMIRSSQWEGWFYRYDGTSWTSGSQLTSTANAGMIGIAAVSTQSGTKLLFIYNRQGWPGYVYLRTSTNQGSSWSSAVAILNDHTDYYENDIMNINGTIIVLAARYDTGELDMVISRNEGSTWTSEKTILEDRGLSSYWGAREGFTVGFKNSGRILCLAYEASGDEIKMIYSKDWGSNWLSEDDELTLQSSTSLDPMFDLSTSYLSYLKPTATGFDVDIIDVSDLYLDDISPRNLTAEETYLHVNLSWDPPEQRVFSDHEFLNYSIYRGTSPDLLTHYRSLGNVTWFNDTVFVTEPTVLYYAVTSTFAVIGESTYSNIVMAEPLVPPPIEVLNADPGDFHVNLSWIHPPAAIGDMFTISHFTLYRGGYFDSGHPLIKIDPDRYWYNDTTVARYPGMYHYWISYTLSGFGEMQLSHPATAKPNTLPDAPDDLSFDDRDQGVTLSWDLVPDDGNYPIDSYNVYRGHSKENMQKVQKMDAPALHFDDDNLTTGETYFYRITASNHLGEGRSTEPIMIGYRTVPSAPRNVMAVGSDGKILVAWSPPRVDWDMNITAYDVYRSGPGEPMGLRFQVSGNQNSFSDPVDNGIPYTYWVSAWNDFGEGGISNPVESIASGVPGRIPSVKARTGDSFVELIWGQVENDGGSELTGYRLYSSLDDVDPKLNAELPTGLRTYRDPGLVNGRQYFYWISPINANGEGVKVGPISAIPGKNPFMISEISAAGSLFSIRLSWEQPDDGGDDIISYRIYRGLSSHSMAMVDEIDNDRSNDPYYMDTGLDYGPIYYYGVTAVNSLGESVLSPIIPGYPYGLPSAPELYSIQVGQKSLFLSWYPPEDTGGRELLNYVVYYREKGSSQWSELVTTSNGQILVNLVTGRTYDVRISAFNLDGEGDLSPVRTVLLGDVPDIPEDLTAVAGDRSVILKWSVPESMGSPILGYRLYVDDENGEPRPYDVIAPGKESITLSDLMNGKEHVFRLSAFNGIGEGLPSAKVRVTPIGLPGPVNNVWVLQASIGSATIEWGPPQFSGGAPIIGYKVYRGTSLNELTAVATIDGRAFFEDIGLRDGTAYLYRVTAVTEMGEGQGGEIIEVIPFGVPSSVRDLRIDASTDTIELSWLPPEFDGGDPVAGYIIYKGTNPVVMELWKQVDPSSLSVKDEDVSAGTYYYRIVPFNTIGTGDAASIDTDVPSRTATAVVIGIAAFMAPLILVFLIMILPMVIRRGKERKAEREAKEAITREEAPHSSMTGPRQPLSLAPGGMSRPGAPQLPSMQRPIGQGMRAGLPGPSPINVLPPMQAAPRPPAQTDGYIRPEAMRPQPKDKESILRQDGLTPSQRKGIEQAPPAPGDVLDKMRPPGSVDGPPLANEPIPGAAGEDDPIELLRKLKDLKDQGLLTEAEFEQKRSEIIKRI